MIAPAKRRVVVTGLGVVSPFGYGIDALWDAMLEGRSALRRVTAFDPSGFRCQVAAEARGYRGKDHVPKHYRKAVKVMARDIEIAVGAAKAATEHAGIVTKAVAEEGQSLTYDQRRVGCQIGAGLIACEVPELATAMSTATQAHAPGEIDYDAWGETGMHNLTPLWLLKYLPNMLACHVTILHEAKGPSNPHTCGEASGALSIGESLRVIQRGDADCCFSGGAESKINPMGMIRMGYVGQTGAIEAPEGDDDTTYESAIRPYDARSQGGALGEGGGIAILEAKETADARGERTLAELVGFGAAQSFLGDDPAIIGRGLELSITRALSDAGISPGDIDAIVPLATGSPRYDEAEAIALRKVFGESLANIELLTSSPNIGVASAGASSLAFALGVMALHHKSLPARIHHGEPAPGLCAGAAEQRDAPLTHVLVCSSAFSGQHGSLVLRSAS
ncbi:MAG: beta-ketoacyl synthase N-terminal-like domain-containing protein [Planctomycetota bacterium]